MVRNIAYGLGYFPPLVGHPGPESVLSVNLVRVLVSRSLVAYVWFGWNDEF